MFVLYISTLYTLYVYLFCSLVICAIERVSVTYYIILCSISGKAKQVKIGYRVDTAPDVIKKHVEKTADSDLGVK